MGHVLTCFNLQELFGPGEDKRKYCDPLYICYLNKSFVELVGIFSGPNLRKESKRVIFDFLFICLFLCPSFSYPVLIFWRFCIIHFFKILVCILSHFFFFLVIFKFL